MRELTARTLRRGPVLGLWLLLAASLALSQHASNDANSASSILDRVAEFHGAPGPFAVAGYRIGERALRELNLSRGSFAVEVIHRTPFEVQWSCIADGLQAATGVSAGKLNLRLVETTQDQLETIVRNRKTGEELVFRLQPSFLKKVLNLPSEQLNSAGAKVLSLREEEVFSMRLQPTSPGAGDK